MDRDKRLPDAGGTWGWMMLAAKTAEDSILRTAQARRWTSKPGRPKAQVSRKINSFNHVFLFYIYVSVVALSVEFVFQLLY